MPEGRITVGEASITYRYMPGRDKYHLTHILYSARNTNIQRNEEMREYNDDFRLIVGIIKRGNRLSEQ